MAQTLLDPGLSTFWERTIGNQAGPGVTVHVWGQAALELLHTVAEVVRRAALAVAGRLPPSAATRSRSPRSAPRC